MNCPAPLSMVVVGIADTAELESMAPGLHCMGLTTVADVGDALDALPDHPRLVVALVPCWSTHLTQWEPGRRSLHRESVTYREHLADHCPEAEAWLLVAAAGQIFPANLAIIRTGPVVETSNRADSLARHLRHLEARNRWSLNPNEKDIPT